MIQAALVHRQPLWKLQQASSENNGSSKILNFPDFSNRNLKALRLK